MCWRARAREGGCKARIASWEVGEEMLYGALIAFMSAVMGAEVMAYPSRRPARPCALERVPRTTRLGYCGTRGAREEVGQAWFILLAVGDEVDAEGEGMAKSTYASSTTTTPFQVG